MSLELIQSLHVENFRCFDTFEIKGLKRVNLVGGKNNAGKTSFMEALHILCSEATRLYFLASARENNSDMEQRTDDYWLTSLWHGMPDFAESQNTRIVIKDQTLTVTVQRGYCDAESEAATGRSRGGADRPFRVSESIAVGEPAYRIQAQIKGDKKFFLNFPILLTEKQPRVIGLLPGMRERIYHIPVAYSWDFLAHLWDKIQKTPGEGDIIRMMQIIDPELEDLLFSQFKQGGVRVPFVVFKGGNGKRHPLSVLGEGLKHILSIGLMLCSMEHGVALIDEIETGLHYSVQEKLWNMIFELAEKRDLQIFATTHSNDSIHAFWRVAAALGKEKNSSYIRLQQRGNGIVGVAIDTEIISGNEQFDIELR